MDPVEKYVIDHSAKLTPEQAELLKVTKSHAFGRMASDADQITFLQNLALLIGAKKTLDVGVLTGLSAMSIALVLPPGGKVVACDINEEYIKVGRPFWESAGVADKIDVRIAPAGESLQKLIDGKEEGTFDFAFIDADKGGYDDYYEKCLILVRSGGIIALDNMLWGGRVADPNSNSADTQALKRLNDKVFQDERVRSNLIKIGDGTVIVFKK